MTQNIFPLLSNVYYFQIWNKKEHKIIGSRVISSPMGPIYIETPYIFENAKWFSWQFLHFFYFWLSSSVCDEFILHICHTLVAFCIYPCGAQIYSTWTSLKEAAR